MNRDRAADQSLNKKDRVLWKNWSNANKKWKNQSSSSKKRIDCGRYLKERGNYEASWKNKPNKDSTDREEESNKDLRV